ncbi:MAG TPA: STAS domain-containing protein, partial [Acidocella sp.]|nr:STAS domain-containing protein [Acidocella sp.]
LDSTALDALAECDATLQKSGCRLLLARVKDQVHALLTQTAPELADKSRCFRSVVDAYNAAARE